MKGEERNIHRDLIIRSQQHDAKAQAELYGLYARAMFNICRRMMGDDEEAQDQLQESFVDAFQKLPSLREVSTFSAWIKRIVVNNCINAIRKRKLLTSELDENLDMEEEVDDFEYTEYKASQVMELVENLPDGCKTVLNLYLFEGYDHKEIGQILSISESASKAQYCKAKARIRNMLEARQQQHAG
ncbi:MAG: sigma-70 family RNA polymerase sigma factor [Cyclobacteriaceae bacterium]